MVINLTIIFFYCIFRNNYTYLIPIKKIFLQNSYSDFQEFNRRKNCILLIFIKLFFYDFPSFNLDYKGPLELLL